MGGLSNHCFSHIKSKLSPSKDCAPEHAWGAVDAQSSFHDLKKGSKYQKINPRPRILICTFDWSVPWLLRSKIWGNKTILLSSWRIKSHLEYASEHLPRFEGTMYGWNPVKKKKNIVSSWCAFNRMRDNNKVCAYDTNTHWGCQPPFNIFWTRIAERTPKMNVLHKYCTSESSIFSVIKSDKPTGFSTNLSTIGILGTQQQFWGRVLEIWGSRKEEADQTKGCFHKK